MYSNIYSCLFHDADIKVENIIDSKATWTEANVVIRSQNVQKDETFVIIKKHTQSLLRLLGGLRAINELETLKIISKHLHRN